VPSFELGEACSIAGIVPIVDHVLRPGTGRGIQSLMVYPNALATACVTDSTLVRA
jgi:hypothetical protein